MRLHINAVGAVMGGASTHLGPFMTELRRQEPNWDVTLYLSVGTPTRMVPEGVSVVRVPYDGRRRVIWDGFAVARRARRDRAEALLNLTNYGPFMSRVPYALYQRNATYFDPAWVRQMSAADRGQAAIRREIAFRQMRAAAITITPTEAMRAFLLGWRGSPKGVRVVAVPHGVDVQRFHRAQETTKSERPGPLRLLSVGHAAPHKDQALLIRAVHLLRERGIETTLQLTVANEDSPEYVVRLRRLAETLNVQAHVAFLGRVERPEDLYQQADIMVFPSLTESFGFPLVEAMASGLPVVASDIPASREILGNAGWYFTPGDVDDATRQLQDVIAATPQAVTDRIQRGTHRAAQFTWSDNVARVIDLLTRLR